MPRTSLVAGFESARCHRPFGVGWWRSSRSSSGSCTWCSAPRPSPHRPRPACPGARPMRTRPSGRWRRSARCRRHHLKRARTSHPERRLARPVSTDRRPWRATGPVGHAVRLCQPTRATARTVRIRLQATNRRDRAKGARPPLPVLDDAARPRGCRSARRGTCLISGSGSSRARTPMQRSCSYRD